MTRVWKFELDPDGIVEMPEAAEVLSAGAQGQRLLVWALCAPSASKVTRRFVVTGTGHDVPSDIGRFIDTVHMGPMVWHVWEAALDSESLP